MKAIQADECHALSLLAEAGDGSMRDALSIMDQAIASAPCSSMAKARLDLPARFANSWARSPNAVFERILQAVDRKPFRRGA